MNDNREPTFWPWFILLMGCCGAVGYFSAHGDHITSFAVIAIVLSALTGYSMTASRLLCWYTGLVVAGLLSSKLIQFGRPTLTEWLGTSGFVLSVIATGCFTTIATAITLQRLIVRYFPARPSLQTFNRLAGFSIGAGQGAMLCALVLGGVLVIEPVAKNRLYYDAQSRDHKVPPVLSAKVIEYARQTRASAIGPTVAHYNPFLRLPSLREFHYDLLGLAHPLKRTPSKSERALREHFLAR